MILFVLSLGLLVTGAATMVVALLVGAMHPLIFFPLLFLACVPLWRLVREYNRTSRAAKLVFEAKKALLAVVPAEDWRSRAKILGLDENGVVLGLHKHV